MSLKAQLAEFLGEQVHVLPVTLGKKVQTFHFRELSGDEVEAIFEQARGDDETMSKAGNRELRKLITAASLCNEDGSPSDLDAAAIAKLPNRLASQLQAHALRLNGLLTEESDPKA